MKPVSISHAMVLAAGLGLRMRPLTLTRPKPLIEVGGQSMLDHALDRLATAGIADAVVNAHYLADQIEAHLQARTRPPRTQLSREAELLETGGGVKRALPMLGRDPFFVINADILWLDGPTPALQRLKEAWNPARMDALLLLTPTVAAVGYEGRGDFHMDPYGRLSRRSADNVAPFVFSGVHITRPELFADTPGPDSPNQAFSNNLIWNRAEAAGRLYGLRHDGAWFHVGTPEAIDDANERIRLLHARAPAP